MDGKEADVLVNIGQMPDEVIGLILKRVPAKELLTACTQVSKQWHRILSQKFFWKEKMEEVDGYPLPWRRLAAGLSVNSYQRMAIKQPFSRNFIRDSWDLTKRNKDCFQLDGRWRNATEIVWQNDGNPGRCFKVGIEVPPTFSEQPNMGPELGGEPVLACLATNCSEFLRVITIRLADEGLTVQNPQTSAINASYPLHAGRAHGHLPTVILVSELVANRFGTASQYQMLCLLARVEFGFGEKSLLTEFNNGRIKADFLEKTNDKCVGAFRRKRFQQGEAESWHLVRHEFKQYTVGMRYLILICTGKAGGYDLHFNGVKVARCSVMALCEGNA